MPNREAEPVNRRLSTPATSRACAAYARRTSRTPIPRRGSTRKGKQQESRLCYLGHVLSENRNGLVVHVELTAAAYNLTRLANIEAAAA